jgi:hypothetical protein
MKRITRERVKVDRVACPWLIYEALYAYCRGMIRRGKPDGAFR